jgi:hypothetical protein
MLKAKYAKKIESTSDLETYSYGKNTIGASLAHRKTKPFPFAHPLKDKNKTLTEMVNVTAHYYT